MELQAVDQRNKLKVKRDDVLEYSFDRKAEI
jgi:hypothetical protein